MTTTLAQVEAALAARFEGLRRPCESHNSEGAYISGRHIYKQSVDCPDCSGLLYVPNCTTDAMLEVTDLRWIVELYKNHAGWFCSLDDEMEKKDSVRTAGPCATPREALARALAATLEVENG